MKIRKDIKREPTELEKKCIKQYGQKLDQKCLDCGTPTYYFNQCERCNEQMIAFAKIQY